MCELLDRADATVFVYDEQRADAAAMAKEKCKKIKYFISMQKEASEDGIESFSGLLAIRQPGFSCDIDPDALCTIMFTSGTTGKSKGVMLTQRNMAENAQL